MNIVKNTTFLLILGIILLSSALFYLLARSPLSPVKSLLQLRFKPITNISQPSFTTVAKPAPVPIRSLKGTIAALNNTILSLKDNSGTKSYIITKTFDFQKVTSGTIEHGDAKTIPVKFSDLKVGQKVFVITPKDSNYVQSIYILN